MVFGSKTALQRTEDKIDQKRLENAIAFSSSGTLDSQQVNPVVPAVTPAEKITAGPAGVVPPAVTLPETKNPSENISITPPAKAKVKPAAKTVLKKIEPAAVKSVAASAANFSIQVSAHTSMEKARAVEDSLRAMGLKSYLVEATVN